LPTRFSQATSSNAAEPASQGPFADAGAGSGV
jgi:hypothetical protein